MEEEFLPNERLIKLRKKIGLTADEFSLETGIKTGQIRSIENKRQKLYAWHIEKISKKWPEYSYWLATGLTIPEAGQISPELEEQRQKLGKAG